MPAETHRIQIWVVSDQQIRSDEQWHRNIPRDSQTASNFSIERHCQGFEIIENQIANWRLQWDKFDKHRWKINAFSVFRRRVESIKTVIRLFKKWYYSRKEQVENKEKKKHNKLLWEY